ncbi:MAG: class I adenylate-forming enzyme family protein [Methyloceanibacter sp.]
MPLEGPALAAPVEYARCSRWAEGSSRPAHARLARDAWSWRELEERTTRLAEPGDRIASLMPNRTALIAHHLACFKTGLVATPLNYRYTPPEIDHALDVSGARIILAHDGADGRHRG